MERMKEAELPDIPAAPHQPANFNFPRRCFGKSMRACQASWFRQFTFLHYDESKDVVYCHICVSAFRQKKMKEKNAEPAFVSTPY